MFVFRVQSQRKSRILVSKLFFTCLLAASSVTSAGVFQHSHDMQDYKLTYDDARLVGYDMNLIVWFSPWYNDPPGKLPPYQPTMSFDGRTNVVDKGFIAPGLELGWSQSTPPNANAFRSLALKNLEDGRRQVEALSKLGVPSVLDSVKTYLLDGLKFSLKISALRYDYIVSGDARPLREALCAECSCPSEEQEVLPELENIGDFKARVKRSYKDWPNAMNLCYTSKHSTYPVASWNAFLKQFGIHEYHREKSPD